MHEIISETAVLPGSTTTRLYCASAKKDSLKSQSGCGKLSERSASRLRKEILGTGDKEVATTYTILESFLEFLNKNQNAPRPSGYPPVKGGGNVKTFIR